MTRRAISELAARLLALAMVIGLPLAAFATRWVGANQHPIELHARIAEVGGWMPGDLKASVGEPLHLRLTSDDVMHGFAIGQSDQPALDVPPGQMVETTLTFDKPGTYVFYCTRWCGPNHWRMRGTIEVTGETVAPLTQMSPLYVALGLDLNSPHPASVVPTGQPSAAHGADLGGTLTGVYQDHKYYRAHSPAQTWQALRAEPMNPALSDADVWDVVAFMWQSHRTREALVEGQRLYAQNCAACHGESGAGNGVFAQNNWEANHNLHPPANFTDAIQMLGASPALLQGKIIRGGMGTGMPYWGPIFTEAQTWALVDYLWTFQFEEQP